MSSIYSAFLPTFLYIKRHKNTGKLYFGKTTKNPEKYLGSGIHWKKHLKAHGKDIETVWYCLFFDEQTIKETALSFSKLWNIVESTEWLNLIDENGLDGGDTTESINYQKYLTSDKQKLKSCRWWNDGVNQIFSPNPPNDSYTRGRLPYNNIGSKIGANIQKQKIWVTNEETEFMVFVNEIPEGFQRGRLSNKAFSSGSQRYNPKGTKWWTNGRQNKMSTVSPGIDWRLGRTISQSNHLQE